VFWTPVPEATIHEDRNLLARKDNIRADLEAGEANEVVLAKSETHAVER
jgi:hypothetical protein